MFLRERPGEYGIRGSALPIVSGVPVADSLNGGTSMSAAPESMPRSDSA